MALLLVLTVLVLCTTTLASLAAAASHARAARSMAQASVECDDLRSAADGAIAIWLERTAPTVSLPPEVTQPVVGVLNETWIIDEVEVQMQVTAYDQCGMVPWKEVRNGSQLRLSLPQDVMRAVEAVRVADAPGLDLVADFPGSWRAVFPVPGDPLPGVGALVATHGTDPPSINLSTAPMTLVEHALRAAGKSGTEVIAQARRAGRTAPAPDTGSGDGGKLRLVSSSTAWAFRLDLRVGPVRRSWWEVFVKDRSGWRLEQRLAIDS